MPKISSKAINHPFNKTLLFFADFSRLTPIMRKQGKRSSDIADRRHVFSLRKVLRVAIFFSVEKARI